MYLTLPLNDPTTGEAVPVRVFADDEKIHAFADAYYPLNDETASIFVNSFSREHRASFDAAADPDILTEIVQCELDHALGLVHECNN